MHKTLIKFRKSVQFFINVILFACLLGSFMFCWQKFYSDTVFSNKGNYAVAALYLVILFLFAKAFGATKFDGQKFTNLFFSLFFTLITSSVMAYVIISIMDYRLVNVQGILVLVLIQLILAIIYSLICYKIYFILYPVKTVILVHGDVNTNLIKNKIISKTSRYKLLTIKHQNDNFAEICEYIDMVDGVFFYEVNGIMGDNLIKYCYDKNKRVYIIPNTVNILVKGSIVSQLSDVPMFICKNRGLTIEQRITKRFMDIVISSIALIILSPIMLIIALAIKLYDKGTVFYTQERITRDGKVFNIFKFRSMIVDAEKNGDQLTTENDNRITPIGKIIRATRLDETPQLINILIGDMSIVGPRGERPETNRLRVSQYPDFDFRTKVKSGLTGYAQLYGKYNTNFIDKIHLDLIYIENYSILLDIKLMIMTLKYLFVRESTEGYEVENPEEVINSQNKNS